MQVSVSPEWPSICLSAESHRFSNRAFKPTCFEVEQTTLGPRVITLKTAEATLLAARGLSFHFEPALGVAEVKAISWLSLGQRSAKTGRSSPGLLWVLCPDLHRAKFGLARVIRASRRRGWRSCQRMRVTMGGGVGLGGFSFPESCAGQSDALLQIFGEFFKCGRGVCRIPGGSWGVAGDPKEGCRPFP
jgi:hypothetical protein